MEFSNLLLNWKAAVAVQFVLTWIAIYFVFMRPRRAQTAPSRTDARYGIRFYSDFKGWLQVDGKKCGIRGVDLNKSGALVSTAKPMTPGARVFLYIESQKLMGWAEVRHCTKRGWLSYHVGLEFRGSLMRTLNDDWEFSSVQGQA